MTKDSAAFKSYLGRKGGAVGYLATMATRTQPTLRPVTFFLGDKLICFCTYAGDAKIRQVKRNAAVAACLPVQRGKNRGYYRVTGRARIIKDRAAFKKTLAKVPFRIEEYFKGPDDPRIALVEVKPGRVRFLEPGKGNERDVKF